jgi:hypothetical protein
VPTGTVCAGGVTLPALKFFYIFYQNAFKEKNCKWKIILMGLNLKRMISF